MNTQNRNHIDEESVAHLARRVAACRKNGSGRSGMIPLELREEILKTWKKSGLPAGHLAKRIGIAGASIGNWARADLAEGKSPRSKASKKKKSFKRVRVVAETNIPKAHAERSFDLELQSGARVSGLRMEDLVQLIRIQGGGR
jgi:hypothetical protein